MNSPWFSGVCGKKSCRSRGTYACLDSLIETYSFGSSCVSRTTTDVNASLVTGIECWSAWDSQNGPKTMEWPASCLKTPELITPTVGDIAKALAPAWNKADRCSRLAPTFCFPYLNWGSPYGVVGIPWARQVRSLSRKVIFKSEWMVLMVIVDRILGPSLSLFPSQYPRRGRSTDICWYESSLCLVDAAATCHLFAISVTQQQTIDRHQRLDPAHRCSVLLRHKQW